MGRDSVPKLGKKARKSQAKDNGGGQQGLVQIDPLSIRYTHSRIRPRFSGCNKTIEETKEEIRQGIITPADLPHITVMPLEDGITYCSLNNRRLFVLHWARKNNLLPNNTIGARIKPMEVATRHAAKYSLERCAASAKLMREDTRSEDVSAGADDSASAPQQTPAPTTTNANGTEPTASTTAATSAATAAAAASPSGATAASADSQPGAADNVDIGATCDDSAVAGIKETKPHRQPAAFLCHGGGPMPILGDPGHKPLVESIRHFASSLSLTPVAIVVVTAHWEADTGPLVTHSDMPTLLYDYYGFPPESYELTYNAPGDKALATRIVTMLKDAGFPDAAGTDRPWDHGTFIPMMMAFPDATIPIVQISLLASQDPQKHIDMGKALSSLRDEGVLIVGSGMSYHNMRGLMSPATGVADVYANASAHFDEWLTETCCTVSAREREQRLAAWTTAPSAHDAHPPHRAEHLMPLMVIAGAAGSDKATRIYNQQDFFGRFTLSSFQFD